MIMQPKTLAIVRQGDAKKGDVLGTARIAGIHGGQADPRIDSALPSASFSRKSRSISLPDAELPGIVVTARVKVAGKTGVEMEALTAVSVACLTVYDMVKAAERGMRIEGIRLIEKRGGRSGHYRAKA